MDGFDYNDIRKDGKVKCYFCGQWVKEYKDVSKLVCLSCAKKMEKIMETIAKGVYENGRSGL